VAAFALHLNHDSTLSVDLAGELKNIELERVYGKRHFDARHERPPVDALAGLLLEQAPTFDEGLTIGHADDYALAVAARVGVSQLGLVDHHAAHAAAAFFQSPFEKSLVLSYDGGGNDGTFRTFLASRDGAGIRPLDDGLPLNLGIPYRAFAHAMREIRKPQDGKERSNAGKLMGLTAFGHVRPEWEAPITRFYHECSQIPMSGPMYLEVLERLRALGPVLGLDLSTDALEGPGAYDLAATAQQVFEQIILEALLPVAARLELPICLTGGCALNVIFNQRLADTVDLPIFVPPNPNDSGLAAGALLARAQPAAAADLTYSGVGITDRHLLDAVAAEHDATAATPARVAEQLRCGNVIAVLRGDSEHGPRALGHRSILCDPSVPGMQDRLNERVKLRETFRPYAPVVRREDVNLFFENARHDMSYMSFNPTVRPDRRTHLAAATHVDHTARVQTVTRKQEPWLYDLLGAFEHLSGFGALLNTSFNSKGQPMVTSIREAVRLWQTTELDCLVIDDVLLVKGPAQ